MNTPVHAASLDTCISEPAPHRPLSSVSLFPSPYCIKEQGRNFSPSLSPPPKSKPPATEVSSSLVLCFHSCYPSAYSPHTNHGKPLESCVSQSKLLALVCPTIPRENINPRRKKTALLTIVAPVPRRISGTRKGEKAEVERPTECRNSAFF